MRFAFASVALLTVNAALAATPIDGLYSSVFGGYAYLPDNVSTSRQGLMRTDASYKGGYLAGGALGYQSNPLRYEGQITYLNADAQHFRINGLRQNRIQGDANAILAMANVYYDFPEFIPCIQPFLGMGIGYAWVEMELNSLAPTSSRFKDSDSAFAYQATAGLTYNYAENLGFNLGYRYVSTNHIDPLGERFQAHLAQLGAVYRFDGNRYK